MHISLENFGDNRKKGTVEVESEGRMSFEISLRGYP